MSAQISAIRVTLHRIREAIRQEKNNALTAASSKRLGDPQREGFWRKLATYEADLRRIHRDLLGRLSSLEHQRANLWNVPRDHRYSARQSIDDREAITQDLVDDAAKILIELLDLYGDVSSMKPGDWESVFQKLIEFGDKVDHAMFHTVVRQLPKGPAIVNPTPGVFALAHLAPMIGLIAAIISSRLRRRS